MIATLGPATDAPEVMAVLVAAGLDVARINFAHGTPEENRRRIDALHQAARNAGRTVAVLADLPGPKIRAVLAKPLELAAGQEVTLATTRTGAADIQVTEPEPIRLVRPGQRLLLDDGRLQLKALRLNRRRLVARVEIGGTLLPKKGINLPETPLAIPAITDRDHEALAVAAAAGVDWLALSFVREPGAVGELRGAAHKVGLDVPLLAKVELAEAVARAREIIEAFDGVLMDRGDLGVQIPLENVPHQQKQLIALARAAGKPVITATDMLDSMRTSPRPTRAEVSDVANAIYDGTDALMLSGETAVGRYPVEALACMDRIARATEGHLADDGLWDVFVPCAQIKDRMTHLTCALAREVGADVILTPTHTGNTPRLVSRHRPRAAIVAPTPKENVVRRLALVWGVLSAPLAPPLHPGEDWLEAAVRAAFAHQVLRPGDLAVVLAGHLVEGGKWAPTLRVVRINAEGRSCAP
ncbi:MAG: pyruvate kinase [Planctomycetes bacterium]|nr:pyruvate kinase [Planctomycetota bacterium]